MEHYSLYKSQVALIIATAKLIACLIQQKMTKDKKATTHTTIDPHNKYFPTFYPSSSSA